jgi:cysteine-rich repeat protein
MMTISRSISVALALGLALAACFIASEPMLWKECSNGNLCPVDTVCSEDGARCLSCGNGILEEGEACDDGNLIDGADACDRNCTKPACGNGVHGAGEACDDGNVRNGDLCSSDCLTACPDGCHDDAPEATEREAEAVPPPAPATPPAEVDSEIRAGKQ